MRIEFSGAVQFADKNFVHRTISIEDTRLEAKAMDTKKISRPRTSTKEQRHRGKCSQKKKSSKFFRAISKNMDLQNFFLAKKVFKKIFRRSPREENKKGLRKFYVRFLAFFNKILMVQKIVLSSSRGEGNF